MIWASSERIFLTLSSCATVSVHVTSNMIWASSKSIFQHFPAVQLLSVMGDIKYDMGIIWKHFFSTFQLCDWVSVVDIIIPDMDIIWQLFQHHKLYGKVSVIAHTLPTQTLWHWIYIVVSNLTWQYMHIETDSCILFTICIISSILRICFGTLIFAKQ